MSIDINTKVALTLEEIAIGTKKALKYMRNDSCAECSSTESTSTTTCKTCNGRREVQTEYIAKLDFPAGVTSGMVLAFNNRGHIIQNLKKKKGLFAIFSKKAKTSYGKLNVKILEIPHEVYTREKNDLIYNCILTSAEAKTGKLVILQDLAGNPIKIQIPDHISNGKILRIAGQGLPEVGTSNKGSLMINIIVK